mmetsp:Transcript_14537/g.20264  ORF Transcript_14537/g.20264 Transcript_14537/m.20264 type:complete len:381 (-) Transcript_14537:219-1361(-)
MVDLLQQGIDVIKTAINHDSAMRYTEASYLYELGTFLLRESLRYEKSDQTKQVTQQKIVEYTQRLNQIKSIGSTSTTSTRDSQNQSNISTTQTSVLNKSGSNSSQSLSNSSGNLRQSTNNNENDSQAKSSVSYTSTKSPNTSSNQLLSSAPQIDWASLQKAEKAKRFESNEEVSSSKLFNYLEKALAEGSAGEAEESKGNYDVALELYTQAAEWLSEALEHETNPDVQKTIKNKLDLYVSKAELIYDSIKKQRITKIQKIQVSPQARQHVDNAIAMVSLASDDDACGKIEQAIDKYQQACTSFNQALQVEIQPEIKNMIKERLVEYYARIEQLKIFLSSGKTAPRPIPLSGKQGEKYKEPPSKKKSSSGLFGKKEKKTWK